MSVAFSVAIFAWGSPPPPPPPSFLEDPASFLQDVVQHAKAPIQTKVEELAAANDLPVEQAYGILGGVLMFFLSLFMVLKVTGSKSIVATCEIGVSANSDGISPTVRSPVRNHITSGSSSHLDRRPSAKQFVPERATKVSGSVTLTQAKGVTTIEYKVVGLDPGEHGLHIHRNGGDETLAKITADMTGTAKGVIRSSVKLSGANSVIGRSINVHHGMVSNSKGLGARIACGAIKAAA